MRTHCTLGAKRLAHSIQLLGIVLGLMYVDCHAQAQSVRVLRLDAVSALVRKWVVESDFERVADQYGILVVLQGALERPSTPAAVRELGFESQVVWMASHYGPFPVRQAEAPWRRVKYQTPRSKWLAGIDADCLKPPGWPRNLSWEKREPLCRSMVRRAEALFAGARPPCEGGPLSHWGGPIDDHRVRRQSDPRSASYREPEERWVVAPWRCWVDGEWHYPANRFQCDPREHKCSRPEEA